MSYRAGDGLEEYKERRLTRASEGKFDLFITPIKASPMSKTFAATASRFSSSRLTRSVQSKLLPHNCTMPSRLCPAEGFVVLKFLCRIVAEEGMNWYFRELALGEKTRSPTLFPFCSIAAILKAANSVSRASLVPNDSSLLNEGNGN